jgi:hypothetical protein
MVGEGNGVAVTVGSAVSVAATDVANTEELTAAVVAVTSTAVAGESMDVAPVESVAVSAMAGAVMTVVNAWSSNCAAAVAVQSGVCDNLSLLRVGDEVGEHAARSTNITVTLAKLQAM